MGLMQNYVRTTHIHLLYPHTKTHCGYSNGITWHTVDAAMELLEVKLECTKGITADTLAAHGRIHQYLKAVYTRNSNMLGLAPHAPEVLLYVWHAVLFSAFSLKL